MGTNNQSAISLADALFSKGQQRVLGVFFSNPERDFYASEIAEREQTGRGALQRELDRLTQSGLVTVTLRGRQKLYRVNPDSPIFAELRSIVQKTIGVVDVIKTALFPHANQISNAFIYGSVSRGTDTAASDVDLMVISDQLSYSELYEILSEAERTVGRKINPTLYSPSEFRAKLADNNHFLKRVMEQSVVMVLGKRDDLN
jgi:predicted nucleotidyltransferase